MNTLQTPAAHEKSKHPQEMSEWNHWQLKMKENIASNHILLGHQCHLNSQRTGHSIGFYSFSPTNNGVLYHS